MIPKILCVLHKYYFNSMTSFSYANSESYGTYMSNLCLYYHLKNKKITWIIVLYKAIEEGLTQASADNKIKIFSL